MADALKKSSKALTKSVENSVVLATKVAEKSTELANTAVNVATKVSNQALRSSGVIANQALKSSEKISKSAFSVAETTAETANSITKIMPIVANSGRNITNASLKSTAKVYRSGLEGTADVATSAIRTSTKSMSTALDLIGNRVVRYKEMKDKSNRATLNINTNKEIEKEFKNRFLESIKEINLGIIAAINAYLQTIRVLRHFIYVKKNINHFWFNKYPKGFMTLKKRTNNANNTEKKVEKIWTLASQNKKIWKTRLEQTLKTEYANYQTIQKQNKSNMNKSEEYKEFLKIASEKIALIMESVKNDYEAYIDIMNQFDKDELKELHNNIKSGNTMTN